MVPPNVTLSGLHLLDVQGFRCGMTLLRHAPS